MLTRLKVSGFKNLVDVDISFGPFTCIAGANGSGKSNLFDAIEFLSLLTENTLVDAASKVRNEGGRGMDVRNLFHRLAEGYDNRMTFEAEMIIPKQGIDDLGREAKATTTFVRYTLELTYQKDDEHSASVGALKILKEELNRIPLGSWSSHLGFPHKPTWRESVLQGHRRSPFISTEDKGQDQTIKLHQDKAKAGRTRAYKAANMPRTLLSTVNAIENPTALLARREMQSWRIQQLEPSSLREPDPFMATPRLTTKGGHLPAHLFSLAHSYYKQKNSKLPKTWIYDQMASNLSQLIDDVDEVTVYRDEKRELLTLMIKDKNGTKLPAHCLSDGTLRFLALSLLKLDDKASGLVCLEEPENGIHPERIRAMLDILQDIAMDTDEAVGPDNPFRQVIINTHSPAFVSRVPEECLIVAKLTEVKGEHKDFKAASFRWLPDTWRAKLHPDLPTVDLGTLLYYLNPYKDKKPSKRNRVMDREDIQPFLPFNKSGQ
jgi:predicted ATPase